MGNSRLRVTSSKKVSSAMRRAAVARLLMQHLTQHQIVDALAQMDPPIKTSQATVSRDCRRIQEEWRQDMLANVDTLQARELRELDQMEREAIRDWLSSSTVIVEERLVPDPRSPGEHRVMRNERRGPRDPRYLDLRLRIKKRRAEMVGLDVPQVRVNIGVDLERLDEELEGMTDEQLAVIAGYGVTGFGPVIDVPKLEEGEGQGPADVGQAEAAAETGQG